MPGSFLTLDVPAADGTGTPLITTLTGSPKTFVFTAGRRPIGRYIVEGSNDGGATWDILVGRDGTEGFFAATGNGIKTIDAIVDRVRVRSAGNGQVVDPPSITLGAPPANGVNIFGVLPVAPGGGLGDPVDLGTAAGPAKTFTLRGPVPAGSRYSILASMDGAHYGEIALITADQDGARATSVMCRFLRVLRSAAGSAPVVTFGSEGIFDPTGLAASLSIDEQGLAATSNPAGEELLWEYAVPLGALGRPALGSSFAALSVQGATAGRATFRVRLGGTPRTPDGFEAVALVDTLPGEKSILGNGAPFSPGADVTLVKVTAEGDGQVRPALRGFVLLFHP